MLLSKIVVLGCSKTKAFSKSSLHAFGIGAYQAKFLEYRDKLTKLNSPPIRKAATFISF